MPCVRLLLDRGARPNLKKDNGHTALMAAAQNGHSLILGVLLAAGADAEVERRDGSTALSLAEEKGQWQASKLLREHTGQPAENKGYYTSQGAYPDDRRGSNARGGSARSSKWSKAKGSATVAFRKLEAVKPSSAPRQSKASGRTES